MNDSPIKAGPPAESCRKPKACPAANVKKVKPGPPVGTKYQTSGKIDHASLALTRCKACQSTQRAPYTSYTANEIDGIDSSGKPYNLVVWRRTHCVDCGQHRIDKSFEFCPKGKKKQKPPCKRKMSK